MVGVISGLFHSPAPGALIRVKTAPLFAALITRYEAVAALALRAVQCNLIELATAEASPREPAKAKYRLRRGEEERDDVDQTGQKN